MAETSFNTEKVEETSISRTQYDRTGMLSGNDLGESIPLKVGRMEQECNQDWIGGSTHSGRTERRR